MVYVISKSGKPLMPTKNHKKVRLLLKNNKAKVLRREPFTIKLLYETTEYTQPITHGIDTGSGEIGSAAFTNGEIVYFAQIKVRNDIKKEMTQRRTYRRTRRNRKTRYRKPRFLNRGNSKRKGRLCPTIISKLQAHEREINFVKKILPVTKLVLECGNFDPHLMKNPALHNPKVRSWGYQKGPNYGFANTHAMVLARDSHTCQKCKGKRKDTHLEVHHIIFRSQGGTDNPDNLITLCSSCHKDLHDGKIKICKSKEQKDNLVHATQMNVIRSQLLKTHPEAIETYGYVTKENRMALGFEKSHINDAAVIASGGEAFRFATNLGYRKVCVSRYDYQKTKGKHSEIALLTGKTEGFRKFDKVLYCGKTYFVKGKMQGQDVKGNDNGYAILMNVEGEKVKFDHFKKGKIPKLKKLKRLGARKTWMVTSVGLIQNIA